MSESPGVEAALDVLYGVSPEDFIDERKRLSQELRRSGDRAAATRIAKWRKPSPAAWALNHVARQHPELVERWLAAGAALRDASARPAEVGGEGVRSAMAAHRSATSRLLEVVRQRALPGGRPLSDDMLDRARTVLQTAAADSDAGELLRRGRIDEVATESGLPDLPGLAEVLDERQAAATERRTTAEEAAARVKRERKARDRADRRAELQRRLREAEAEAERLTRERRDRVAKADEAAKRVETARAALRDAEQRAGVAAGEVAALEETISESTLAVDRLREELSAEGA